MLLVNNLEAYEQALQFIAESEILAYDVETTGLNTRRDTIIGFGISNGLDGCYFPLYAFVESKQDVVYCGIGDALIRNILVLLASKKLLMFNASFDARFTKYNLGVDLLPALHADVLLLKHTCDEEFPFGLKEIAAKLFGHEVKHEKEELQRSIKEAGGKATEYYKASVEIISRYCVQDCILTFRTYNHYSNSLRKQGLEEFYYNAEVMPLYKEVTIPMEEAGVKMDVPAMQSALAYISKDIQNLEASIQSAIAPSLTIFETWFLNKDYPLETYKGKVPLWRKKYANQYEAWRMQNDGYMFNPQSKHHLKKLFFDTLKLEPLSRTPTGLPQVDEEFLASIADDYAWVHQLIDYNKLNKIRSTYIERLLEGVENEIYYPSFMQHRTVSGRYAGDLQQLPRPLEAGQASELVCKYTNLVRSFIIPRTSNHLLVSADYEQLEPSIFAHTSGDKALQEIFQSGVDFYSEVAIRTERLQGVSSIKTEPSYLGRVDKVARQKAKAYALGIAYGMTGYKLQFEIGVPQNEAEQLVKDYLAAFPSLHKWMETSKDEARIHGFVRSQAGRVRHLPRAGQLHKKYGVRLSDSLHLWKDYNNHPALYEQAKADRREYINLLNNAINFQVQSLAASIINRAAIEIARTLKSEKLASRLVMQVHDELVLDVPKEECERVCTIVKHTMENVNKLTVPLRTTPQIGTNFKECK